MCPAREGVPATTPADPNSICSRICSAHSRFPPPRPRGSRRALLQELLGLYEHGEDAVQGRPSDQSPVVLWAAFFLAQEMGP